MASKATSGKRTTRKRRERKNIERGAAHIRSTFNMALNSNYQVVILKEAQDIKDKEYEQLANYIASPQQSSVFVISCTYSTNCS